MLQYPALIVPDSTGYLVTFRDVPEAVSSGETVEEARTMAVDALWSAIDIYFEQKRVVPMPSALQAGEILIELPEAVSSAVLIFNAALALG